MITLAWGIYCSAWILKTPRNRTENGYEIDNAIDCVLFFIGFGMFLLSTAKG